MRLSPSTPRILACTVSLWLGSAIAHAAPDDSVPEPEATEEPPAPTNEEHAMELYHDGTSAYDQGDYQGALEFFQDAQGLYPSPDFHYNIGQCFEALEKFEQAITSYRAYLRSDPSDAANVRKKIARLETRIEEGGDPTGEAPPPDPRDTRAAA